MSHHMVKPPKVSRKTIPNPTFPNRKNWMGKMIAKTAINPLDFFRLAYSDSKVSCWFSSILDNADCTSGG